MKLLKLLLLPLLLTAVPFPPSRAPHLPLISGDAFRAYCDYAFDEISPRFDPKKVPSNSTIFVKGDFLGRFFFAIHPKILHPYILVTHNSDETAPGPYVRFLEEDKILAWFGQNMDLVHPKMHPIPIGIANGCWPHGDGSILKTFQHRSLKTHCLYLNFSIGTYPQERQHAYDLLSKAPFSFSVPHKSFQGYLEDLASCEFCASPRGNGMDTHRLWEALYLGTIPIVKHSSLDPLYAEFPVILIDSWQQVSETFLQEKKAALRLQSFSDEKLYMPYWTHLINNYKLNK